MENKDETSTIQPFIFVNGQNNLVINKELILYTKKYIMDCPNSDPVIDSIEPRKKSTVIRVGIQAIIRDCICAGKTHEQIECELVNNRVVMENDFAKFIPSWISDQVKNKQKVKLAAMKLLKQGMEEQKVIQKMLQSEKFKNVREYIVSSVREVAIDLQREAEEGR